MQTVCQKHIGLREAQPFRIHSNLDPRLVCMLMLLKLVCMLMLLKLKHMVPEHAPGHPTGLNADNGILVHNNTAQAQDGMRGTVSDR